MTRIVTILLALALFAAPVAVTGCKSDGSIDPEAATALAYTALDIWMTIEERQADLDDAEAERQAREAEERWQRAQEILGDERVRQIILQWKQENPGAEVPEAVAETE